jgi:hypothetical protein
MWPTIPVGKADFERTAARLPGLRVVSFSSKTDGERVINRVKLEFSEPQALAGFLDAGGQGARFSREDGKNRLILRLGSAGGQGDSELAELIAAVSQGYALDLEFELPGRGELLIFDGNGRQLDVPPAGSTGIRGRKLRFSAPMADFLSAPEFTLEIRW